MQPIIIRLLPCCRTLRDQEWAAAARGNRVAAAAYHALLLAHLETPEHKRHAALDAGSSVILWPPSPNDPPGEAITTYAN